MHETASDELARVREDLIALGARLEQLVGRLPGAEADTLEADLLAVEAAALGLATQVQVWRVASLCPSRVATPATATPAWWRAIARPARPAPRAIPLGEHA